MRSGILVKVIAHSVNEDGLEMITLQSTAPKFLDAEVEKHRMISTNSSSDRAIPMNRMVSRPWFLPVDVRLNQKGMQGYEVASPEQVETFHAAIKALHQHTCDILGLFEHIHKQHLNRYLLGFSFQSKVMTATRDQWDYFNGLREAKDADPAIYDMARKARMVVEGDIIEAIERSEPTFLEAGEWHTPYYLDGYWKPSKSRDGEVLDANNYTLEGALKVSAARCARVSYDNFDGDPSKVEEDKFLHDWLITNLHFTPLEHQATPMRQQSLGMGAEAKDITGHAEKGVTHMDTKGNFWSANFKGWLQYRKTL